MSFTKVKSKWITDINIKQKIVKFPEDNTGKHRGPSVS